jgi:DNA-binding transcriptional MerR regulator
LGWDSEGVIRIVLAHSRRRLTTRQLQEWDRKGVVSPRLRGAKRVRIYGLEDIQRLCVIAKLLNARLPSQRLPAALRNIESAGSKLGRPLTTLKIVTDGHAVLVVDGNKALDARTGQFVSLILLGDLKARAQRVCRREASRRRAA